MSRITDDTLQPSKHAEALSGLLHPERPLLPARVEEPGRPPADGTGAALSARGLKQAAVDFVAGLWHEFLHGRHDHSQRDSAIGLVILALGGMQFMALLDGTVANIALYRIGEALHLSGPGRSWVITSYALTFGGLMLLGGRIGDLIGRKRAFLIGVGVFTFGSLLCGLARNEVALLVFRAFQGVGAAVAAPTALALVASLYTPGKARNTAVAIFGAMVGIGSIAGLIFGGALTEVGEFLHIPGLSWQLIFLVNVPIGIGIAVLAWLTIPAAEPSGVKLDVPGALTSASALACFVFGFTQGPIWGWRSPGVLTPLIAGAALLGAFVLVELRSSHPLVPLRLFATRDKVATFAVIVLSGAVVMTLTIYVVLFFQDVLHYSPIKTGLSFIPFAVALGIGSQIAVLLLDKLAPRWTAGIGLAVLLAGFLYASTLDPSATYLKNLLVPILLIGFGVGMVLVPLPLCALVGVPDAEVGALAAVAQSAMELGGPVGLSVIGGLLFSTKLEVGRSNSAGMTATQLAQLSDGYMFALLILAGLALVAGAIGLLIRYTPEQVAQAQAVKTAVDSGVGTETLIV